MKNENVYVRLDSRMKAQLRREAKKTHEGNVSFLIRSVLRQWLEEKRRSMK